VVVGSAFAAPKTYTAKKMNVPSLPSGYVISVVSPNGKKYAGTKPRDGGGREAWYYNGSTLKTIHPVGNYCVYYYHCEMEPTDINNNGDVVGQGKWNSYYTNQDHVWISRNGGTPAEIKATTSVDRSFGASINAYGNIIFTGRQWPAYQHHAFTQHVSTYNSNSGAKDLGTLGDNTASWAMSTLDISSNSSRPIVGYSKNGSERIDSYGRKYDVVKGYIYKNGKMTELPALKSDWNSKAYGINKYGVAVGQAGSNEFQTTYHAVKWQNGKIVDLNIKTSDGSGLDQKRATHITNNGTIHGTVAEYRRAEGGWNAGAYPFVYKDGVQKRLMDLVTSGADFKVTNPIKVHRVNPSGTLFVEGMVEGSIKREFYKLTPN